MSTPDGYERRIGRYGGELAEALIAVAGVRAGQRALDVGCGSGALTERLAARVGPHNVSAVDPSPAAVAACRVRVPGVDAHVGYAEKLPVPDAAFDSVLAQLVFGFVTNAATAVSEMRRAARPGASVATCVWDFAGGMTVLRVFWDAANAVEPAGAAQHDQATTHKHSTPKELEQLWIFGGLNEVTVGELTVGADYADFDDLWEPLTIPDGSPGHFYSTLNDGQRRQLKAETRARLGSPDGPFRLRARAWYALGYR